MPLIIPKPAAGDYSPRYVTTWGEYDNGTALGSFFGWDKPSTSSEHQLIVYDTGAPYAKQLFGNTSPGARANRILNLDRATSYARGTFTEEAGESRQGLTIQGDTGTGRAWVAYMKADPVFTMWVGYVEGTGTRQGLTSYDLEAIGLDKSDLPYELELRAVSATAFRVYVNGTYVTERNSTTGSNGYTGIYAQDVSPDAVRCARFECGIHKL